MNKYRKSLSHMGLMCAVYRLKFPNWLGIAMGYTTGGICLPTNPRRQVHIITLEIHHGFNDR